MHQKKTINFEGGEKLPPPFRCFLPRRQSLLVAVQAQLNSLQSHYTESKTVYGVTI